MPDGIIVKGISSFYYVRIKDKIIECRAKGKFRNEHIVPFVGDYVDISQKGDSFIIDKIYPRVTELKRPPVANINQVAIVLAAAKPEPNFALLDKLLITVANNKLNAIICINKIDIISADAIEEQLEPYSDAGYRIIYTSTVKNTGMEELKRELENKITVLAGPSGVGKSSILNMLDPGINLKTGEISRKIERGRHTTRHCELINISDKSFVADTPGFSSIDIESIKKEKLAYLFPEFLDFLGGCKYPGCMHVTEPGCAVKNAVLENKINKRRYDSYITLFNELKNIKNFK
ncbi:MAG TPA: ribosome small subunit-dependent GTPase A [Clostridiaceae bacterium]|nr:ribosome small subunit-dependent GTPase A [Clostridiaceae bacterium]